MCTQVAECHGRPTEHIRGEHARQQEDWHGGNQKQVGFVFLQSQDHQVCGALAPSEPEAGLKSTVFNAEGWSMFTVLLLT